jgi:hypothetical protein
LPMSATCPTHIILIYHPNNIWWRVQTMNLLINDLFWPSYYFLSFRSKYSLQHHVLRYPQSNLCFQMVVRDKRLMASIPHI